MIGRTVMPGNLMSNRKQLMPCCDLAALPVRTRQKILFAHCAWVVQIWVPLTRQWPLSGSSAVASKRSALHCNAARSEPAPGSLQPWARSSSAERMPGSHCCFWAGVPNEGPANATQPAPDSYAGLAATPVDVTQLAASSATVQPDDVAMVIYTSGTTGRPKGAGLTHHSLLASAATQAAHTRITGDDLIHMASPLNRVGGITCAALTHLIGGGCVVLVPEFKADAMIKLMQRHRPTIVAGVPTVLTLLLMNANIGLVDLSAVRLVFSGGSNVDAVLLERLALAMPGATLMNLYGLTETSGAIVMTPWQRSHADLMSRIGKPFEGAQLRIAGDHGEALAADEIGELWFKGVGVVPGYIGAAAGLGFSADGWLQTGDLGTVDTRGLITLKGRKKDMYIQGGFNVYPAEIEALVTRHPEVVMAAGIGVPDPVMGDVGRLFWTVLIQADRASLCTNKLASKPSVMPPSGHTTTGRLTRLG